MPSVSLADGRDTRKVETHPHVPVHSIVYAVGDIHGRLDLLTGVTDEIRREVAAATSGLDRVTVIFLGDYIDRGPDSRGVIAHLIAWRAEGLCDTVFLRGNHEQILLDLIDDGDAADPMMWLQYGGVETLGAYGVDQAYAVGPKEAALVSERARAALPPAHLDFIRSTRLTAERGDYLFVHAGVRPDRLLNEQTDADLLWYRFFDDRRPVHGKVVVHGHTPRERPVVGRWRIGLDTEAYASGALTAMRLEGADRRFLKIQVAPDTAAVSARGWESIDPPHHGPATRSAGRPDGPRPSSSKRRRSGGRPDRVLLFSRAAVGAALLGTILAAAWFYVGHAGAPGADVSRSKISSTRAVNTGRP